MKILGTIFRLLCALVVLLAVAIYLGCPLQVSLTDYIAAFTPGHIQEFMKLESWFAIAAGALLLLTLCGGIKLGWNIVYSMVTLAFFVEAAVLALGAKSTLPTCLHRIGWVKSLGDFALNYPVPAVAIPVLCILGCFCSSAPVRIALRSLLACLLCYGSAELMFYGLQQWQAMPEPFLPQVLHVLSVHPWLLGVLPAVFFVQYCFFMAMFETFIPKAKKAKTDKKADDVKPEADKPEAEEKSEEPGDKQPATAPKVVVKRPVVHKKSPTPAAADKAPESAPEKKKDEAPAEEKKPEAPASPEPEAPAEESPRATHATEEEAAPKAEEAPKADAPGGEAAPTPIPSVPLPPNVAS